MFSRVIATVVLVPALFIVEAHPQLYDRTGSCIADHHPSSGRQGHGAPTVDASIGFSMAWSAPDGGDEPQDNEKDPMRAIPDAWEIGSNEFKPGARHTLTVSNPNVGEMMVTCQFGGFVEFGPILNGALEYGRGVVCGGKRYDTASGFKKPKTRFIWQAPSLDELNGTDGSVLFKVTTASGSQEPFRNNQVTFRKNVLLLVPVPPPPSPPSPPPSPPLPPPPPPKSLVESSASRYSVLTALVVGSLLFSS